MPLQPLDSPVGDDTPTRVVLAVLACRRPDGTYAFVPADANGLIPTSGGTGGPGGGDVTVLNWPTTQDVAVGNWPAGFLAAVTNWPSSQAVTGTFWQATQPVSGTFWQATQPVSIAAPVAVTGTFWQATQPVSGPLTDAQLRAAAVPVSGTFFQATQPVSLMACPLPSGASTETTLSALNGKVSTCNTGAVTVAASALPSGAATEATLAAIGKPSALTVTATGASGAAVTLTLPAVGGQFHYITHVRIQLYAAAARTGGASPVVVTTTNLPGSLAYTFETAQAIGTSVERVTELAGNPVKSSVSGTATTIVCPVATTGIWRVTVHYYAAA